MTNVPYDTIASWYDEYAVHTPFHQEMVIPSLVSLVGEIAGQTVCDVACGQGIVSRELARRGARVTGVDISAALLDLARDYEARASLGIRYVEDNAEHLRTVADASVDGATCCMALMNVTDLAACMAAVNRVLRPGGWFVATIIHPCFQTPWSRWVVDSEGWPARQVGDYFTERFWESDNPDSVRGRVGEYHRTLSTYLNTASDAGLALERIDEPAATGTRAAQVVGNTQVPSILTMRLRRANSGASG